MKNNNKGFTLMELLIVVAIIGLLASMILVGLSSFRTRGRDARRVADVKQVQNGLEIYYAKENKYPDVQSSGVPGTESAAVGWDEMSSKIFEAGIGISQIPQDPLGDAYSYAYAGDPGDLTNPQSYIIAVKLEDAGSQSLKNDLDGTIFGIDCGDAATDTIYCVQF
jgi:prepilin-type N-terminal cleavage/methylation domain-containing protein